MGRQEASPGLDTTVPGTEAEQTRSNRERAAEQEGIPAAIGRYEVLGRLGEGGMGTVFRAHDPKLDRDVAVKLVRRRASDKMARDRALREGQALARLTHPNVVSVYDVGLHEGRLFIAMELVAGITLSRWTHEMERPWREVLAAYLAAGEALSAAHRSALVHRDFKPQNVMMTDDGIVKVLDFGLVRLASTESHADAPPTDALLDESALDMRLTSTGMCLGTPAYMAPEQFKSGPADARTDQFSFCVLLWEGLYGTRPFAGHSVMDLRRAILMGEIRPPRPSEVPGAIERALRKGLARDPASRYPDLPTLLAALRKASRGSQAWGAVLLGAAVVAVGLTVYSAAEPEEPCQGAAGAIAATWNPQRRAALEAALLDSGRTYATSTWDRLAPRIDDWAQRWTQAHTEICLASQVGGRQTPEQLDHRMACLERARTRTDAFLSVLGEAGDDAVRQAVATAAALPDPSRCPTAMPDVQTETEVPPAVVLGRTRERKRLAEAAARGQAAEYGIALRIALEVERRARDLGDDALRIDALLLQGDERAALGEYRGATISLEEAYVAAVEADDPVLASKAARALLFVYGISLGRPEEALEWYRHADAQLDRTPTRDPLAEAAMLSNLGAVMGTMGRYDESTEHLQHALALEQETLGDDDPRMVPTLQNIANALVNQGRLDEAKTDAERALAIAEVSLGRDHPDVAAVLEVIASVLRAQGDADGAIAASDRALELVRDSYGPEHVFVARALRSRARGYALAGDHAAAVEDLRLAVEVLREQLGELHPELGLALNALAGSLFALGELDEGVARLREEIEIDEHAYGPQHPAVARSLGNLATIERERGALDEAIRLYERALKLGADDPDNAAVLRQNLALALEEAERWTDAEAAFVESAVMLEQAGREDDVLYLEALSGRGDSLMHLGREDEALAVLQRAKRLMDATPRDAPEWKTPQARYLRAEIDFRLALALWRTHGDATEAHDLAVHAREAFAADGEDDRVATIDAALAEHRG